MQRRFLRTVPLVAVILAMSSTALPLDGGTAVPGDDGAVEQFGGNWFVKIIPGTAFVGIASSHTFSLTGGFYFTPTAGGRYWAPIDMDPGAEIAEICLFAYDNSTTASISIGWGIVLMGDASGPSNSVNVRGAATGLAPAPGFTLLCARPAAPVLVRAFADLDNDGTADYNWHRLEITANIDPEIRWGGALVRWRRSVAPAPATATYPNDVPTTSPIFRFVEALSAAGVTAGCGAGSYCPDAPVTRGQMAVFLTAALGLYWPE